MTERLDDLVGWEQTGIEETHSEIERVTAGFFVRDNELFRKVDEYDVARTDTTYRRGKETKKLTVEISRELLRSYDELLAVSPGTDLTRLNTSELERNYGPVSRPPMNIKFEKPDRLIIRC